MGRSDWTQGWWEDNDFRQEVMSKGLRRLKVKAQRGKDLAVKGMFANSNPNPNPPPKNAPSGENEEYPAVQTSNLEQHMGVSSPGVENGDPVIAYGANVKGIDPSSGNRQYEKGYAYYLAVGTDKMAPRPYLQLSLDELENEGF